MKTTALFFSFILNLVTLAVFSQDRTTVTANSNEISDNLDLRAVAHVFGESDNLEDFERRLNDPSLKVSNLDLNYDNQVDYMRVIESVEDNTHLIIVQAVIGRDSFQDIATIEVEKDRRNRTVQVQIVGNTFLYGSNYIYEPVYYRAPVIYRHFWVPNYITYYSPWAWSFYPTYYYAWNPWPIYTYHNHVNYYVNVNNSCYYTSHRRSNRAIAMHHSRGGNAYEKQHPNRSFSERNNSINNRHELTQIRGNNSWEGRIVAANTGRGNQDTRSNEQIRNSQSTALNGSGRTITTGTRDQNSKSAGQIRSTQSNSFNDRSSVSTSNTRGQSSVNVGKQSADRSVVTTRSNGESKTRFAETRGRSNSGPKVDRAVNNSPRSTNVAMNQTRSSKPEISSRTENRNNSSSVGRSGGSSQRATQGNSANSAKRGRS